jgi:hypothetical protein
MKKSIVFSKIMHKLSKKHTFSPSLSNSKRVKHLPNNSKEQENPFRNKNGAFSLNKSKDGSETSTSNIEEGSLRSKQLLRKNWSI